MKPYQTEVPATRVVHPGWHGKRPAVTTGTGTIPATVVPDNNVPNRKWFANLIAAAITWLVVKLGLDSATAASVAAPVAGLLANYAWAEWRSLPETVRAGFRKLTRTLRREDGEEQQDHEADQAPAGLTETSGLARTRE